MSKRIRFEEERFLHESNKIEGIDGIGLDEFHAFDRFMKLDKLMVSSLCELVSVFQPGAELRDRPGMNVTVGNHVPPLGCISIRTRLMELLDDVNSYSPSSKHEMAYEIHHRYEILHPFTDGNGRSGRMLWWKMVEGSRLGFLHQWYYQSLENGR